MNILRIAPIVLIAAACAACDDKKTDAAPPATSAAAAATTAKSSATPAATAAPAAGGSALKSMFAGPAEDGTKESETIYHAGGVILGLPTGWKSGNVKETEDESVNVVGTGFTGPAIGTQRGAAIMCNTQEGAISPGAIEYAAKNADVRKPKWTEEVEGTVGAAGTAAKLGKGTGEQVSGAHQAMVTYYVFTAIPGAKPVLCVASYPANHPESEKEIVTAWKGMKLKK